MLPYIKRTTIKVDDEIDARIRQEAQRRGVTVSEWIREAVAAYLPGGGSADNGARTFRMAAAGTSGQTVIAWAERHGINELATLDRRHFAAVRPRHVRALRTRREIT